MCAIFAYTQTHTHAQTHTTLSHMQGALALQPGCDQGPMAAYERTTLAAMLEARKAQTPLGPLPRDDVGIVVRDAGPGTWRGLMIRKLGSTEGYWYDEAVLLPATNSDIHKQVCVLVKCVMCAIWFVSYHLLSTSL